MNILSHNLSTTHELMTSRGGLLSIASLMQKLNLSQMVDKHFLAPKSNLGYKPSVFVNSMVLMHHEGGIRLDDLKHLQKDKALIKLGSM